MSPSYCNNRFPAFKGQYEHNMAEAIGVSRDIRKRADVKAQHMQLSIHFAGTHVLAIIKNQDAMGRPARLGA